MKTLAIYLMCGARTPELVEAAVEGGADIIELGFPFSDPLADGPVIRRAGERALARGMRTRACLDVLARTHELAPETPLVPMTYASLLEAYGWDRFADDVEAAGAASMIVVDVPAGELADGIVVGSRAVEVAEDGPDALRSYVASLRKALDAVMV